MEKSGLLEIYFKEISKFKVLENDEFNRLFKQMGKEDCPIRQLLINSNLRLVVMIAKQYQHTSLGFEDAISEGNIGLMHALDRYDPEKHQGNKFATYAVWWIRQTILRAMMDKGKLIRIPAYLYGLFKKINEECDLLEQEGIVPTAENVAERFMNEKTQKQTLKYFQQRRIVVVSGSAPTFDGSDEGGASIFDFISDENSAASYDAIVNDDMWEDLFSLIKQVTTEKEFKILCLRIGVDSDDCTLQVPTRTLLEIGADYELTRERIRQIQARACHKILKRLNRTNRSEEVYSYLSNLIHEN